MKESDNKADTLSANRLGEISSMNETAVLIDPDGPAGISWKHLIATQVEAKKLSDPDSRICSTSQEESVDATKRCSCGRLPRQHTTDVNSKTDDPDYHLSIYGELNHGARV